jgi:hypothetical protein
MEHELNPIREAMQATPGAAVDLFNALYQGADDDKRKEMLIHQDPSGNTMLMVAVNSECQVMVQRLLAAVTNDSKTRKAMLTTQNNHQENALMVTLNGGDVSAWFNNNHQMLQILLAAVTNDSETRKAMLIHKNADGQNALIVAVGKSNNQVVVKELLDTVTKDSETRETMLIHKNADGQNALMVAVGKSDHEDGSDVA